MIKTIKSKINFDHQVVWQQNTHDRANQIHLDCNACLPPTEVIWNSCLRYMTRNTIMPSTSLHSNTNGYFCRFKNGVPKDLPV